MNLKNTHRLLRSLRYLSSIWSKKGAVIVFTMMSFFLFGQTGKAQLGFVTDPLVPFEGTSGSSFGIVIEANGGTLPYTWTTAYPMGFPALNDPTSWLTIPSSTTGTLTITANPPSGTEGIFFLEVTVEDADESVTEIFTINITREIYDLVYVLDRSGSMGSVADPNNPPDTKWDVLKESVQIIADHLKDSVEVGDSIGLVYFNYNVAEYAPGLVDLNTLNVSDITTFLNGLTATGSTAMGKGLQSGIDKLTDTSNPRHIILLSDGLQNVSPKVLYSPSVSLNGTDLSSHNILMHTIAIGHTALADSLEAIANATGGEFLATNDPTDIEPYFLDGFVQILRNGSPGIVTYRKETLSGGMFQRKFNINKNVNRLLFQVNWEDNNYVNFRVEKAEHDLTEYGKVYGFDGEGGPSYQIRSFHFPVITANNGSDTITSEGEWTLIIDSEIPGNATIAVIADDHYLKYKGELSKNKYVLDQPLDLKMSLKYAGQPVTGTVEAYAIVLKPGEDLGTLLSTTPTPKYPQVHLTHSVAMSEVAIDPDAIPGETKYELLMNDTAFYNKLLGSENTINLQNNNDGTFTGQFTGTDITGIYKVLFFIKGNNAEIGDYERMEFSSAVVVFAGTDLESTELHTLVDDDAVTVKGILIKPKTASGLYLGPMYGSQIKITSSAGTLGTIIDNLDGSYTIPISGVTVNDRPTYTVSVMGETLYEGKINEDGPVKDTWWTWILLIVILILILLRRFFKKIPAWLLWVLFFIILAIAILQRYGIINL